MLVGRWKLRKLPSSLMFRAGCRTFRDMARRYLDPRNDVVFKKVFGEHPEILRSFLNAVLPLEPDRLIASLEYLPAEQVPVVPLLKNTIVDVRCRDQRGRQFIVEMQMNWTSAFLQRVLFNASKAYVRQLEKSEQYELLKPVMGLALLDDIYDKESAEFYHHYRMVEAGQPERVIDGLELIFVELPKFHAGTLERPLREAWLRFLKETGGADTPEEQRTLEREVASQSPELAQAVELAGEAAFSLAELEYYDRYWDAVRTERTLMSGARREGVEQGIELGLREALRRLAASGISDAEARRMLGL